MSGLGYCERCRNPYFIMTVAHCRLCRKKTCCYKEYEGKYYCKAPCLDKIKADEILDGKFASLTKLIESGDTDDALTKLRDIRLEFNRKWLWDNN